LVLDILKKKIIALIDTQKNQKVIEFLRSLIINDSGDNSKMPNIFKQREEELSYGFWMSDEESKKRKGDPIKIRSFIIDEFSEDILEGAKIGGHEYDPDDLANTTYKSTYYSIILKTLSEYGKESEQAVIECLKEMTSIICLDYFVEKKIDPKNPSIFQLLHGFKRFKKGKEIDERGIKSLEEEAHRIARKYEIEPSAFKEEKAIEEISRGEWGIYTVYNYYEKVELGYPKTVALEALAKIELNKENIEYLVDDFLKEDDECFRENFSLILEILNKQPLISGDILMKRIAKEKNRYYKAIYTRALYHLELGKIGMSKQGVGYLGKTYDLAEHNDPNHFAHRATGDGKVAIFDEKQKAIGYFQLHSFDAPEKILKAEFLNFTYETLFRPQKDETTKEREERMKILEEFKKKYFQTYLTGFYEETGVRFNNLSFPEQGWFLWYAQNASEEDKKRAMAFIKKYREPGFKTFLALEHKQEIGSEILSIGENLNREAAEAIFSKYLSIVDQTERVRNYLRENFGKDKNYNEETVDKIIENLLRKGKDLLVHFANQTETAKREGQKISSREILQQLEKVKTEILLFASTFKAVSAEQPVDFRDIAGTEIKTADSSTLTAEEKKEMERIFVENRPAYSKKLLATTLREFKEALDTPGKKFYSLTHDGELVAFMRFDELPNGNLYAGSLNVRPEARGSAIGSAMLKASLDREAQTRTIEAVVYEKNPMLKHYLKDFDFQIVDEIPDYEGTGQKFFKLERPAERAERVLKKAA